MNDDSEVIKLLVQLYTSGPQSSIFIDQAPLNYREYIRGTQVERPGTTHPTTTLPQTNSVKNKEHEDALGDVKPLVNYIYGKLKDASDDLGTIDCRFEEMQSPVIKVVRECVVLVLSVNLKTVEVMT